MCPGNKIGGLKAAKKNLANDPDFYRKIGSLGGRAKGYKGFATNPELARRAGAKGGKKSRRTGVTTGQGKRKEYYYNGPREFDVSVIAKPQKPAQEPKKSFIKRIFGGE